MRHVTTATEEDWALELAKMSPMGHFLPFLAGSEYVRSAPNSGLISGPMKTGILCHYRKS
jgi:hypothetical protein